MLKEEGDQGPGASSFGEIHEAKTVHADPRAEMLRRQCVTVNHRAVDTPSLVVIDMTKKVTVAPPRPTVRTHLGTAAAVGIGCDVPVFTKAQCSGQHGGHLCQPDVHVEEGLAD